MWPSMFAPSRVRESGDFFSIVAQMPDAISLGVGEPDFVTPWHIREATIFALEKEGVPATLITEA